MKNVKMQVIVFTLFLALLVLTATNFWGKTGTKIDRPIILVQEVEEKKNIEDLEDMVTTDVFEEVDNSSRFERLRY